VICRLTSVAVVIAATTTARGQPLPPVDLAAAERLFQATDAACRREGGRLWGASLCGPVMLIDPRSRAFVSNTQPGDAPDGATSSLWTATYPGTEGIANTSVSWRGRWWAQVMLPLPEAPEQAVALLLHESFHRLQKERGWSGAMAGDASDHLHTRAGRVWLQLEWRALTAALRSAGPGRRLAVSDALAFRAERRRLFPNGVRWETALEDDEGLASDTGVAMAAADADRRRALAEGEIRAHREDPSWVRSFAYASGPAYGALLDEAGGRWREEARAGGDLGELLQRALGLGPPRGPLAARMARYDGRALEAAEQAREAQDLARQQTWRRTLVTGPVLRLPLQRVNASFDPRRVVGLGDAGTVYGGGTFTDAWGTLTATEGVLIDPGWQSLSLTPPDDAGQQVLSGKGWELVLTPGWTVQATAGGQVLAGPAADGGR
jgi:hypothetical protein